ncbi:UNKNOWN [Stylonychia lemnae]|uniref:Uncharacterized protein n=1 Tax=Stylonychia lemnae TaxID=5949 RepID=A0A078APL7_STYLE|nr:UNKNOWN [Stylonychia lemnae]|eukprot:CDW84320.1 UNKNOWN [Stylonychia lemnae]
MGQHRKLHQDIRLKQVFSNVRLSPQKQQQQFLPSTHSNQLSPSRLFEDKMIQVNLITEQASLKTLPQNQSKCISKRSNGHRIVASQSNDMLTTKSSQMSNQNQPGLQNQASSTTLHRGISFGIKQQYQISKDVILQDFDPTIDQVQTSLNQEDTFNDDGKHCNSVEIINTQTILSRNNQKFEVYQYQKDETQESQEDKESSQKFDQTLIQAQKVLLKQRTKQQIIQQRNKIQMSLQDLTKKNLDASINIRNVNNDMKSRMHDKENEKFTTYIQTMSSDLNNILSKMPSDDSGSLMSIKFEDIERQYKNFGINSQSICNINSNEKDEMIDQLDQTIIQVNLQDVSNKIQVGGGNLSSRRNQSLR